MSVGFNHIIIFNNNGKIVDYQKAYNNQYAKTVKIFFPSNINNRKNYSAILSTAINNTYPKQVEFVEGVKSETDLNCYVFDLSEIYRKYKNLQKIGLTRVKLICDSGRDKFCSETFRI